MAGWSRLSDSGGGCRSCEKAECEEEKQQLAVLRYQSKREGVREIPSGVRLRKVFVKTLPFSAFGLWCWAVPVRSGWRAARGLVWFWKILELGNSIGHSALALSRGGYFPGVVTALLLQFAAWLAVLQAR